MTIDNWISVKDKKPDVPVLVYTQLANIKISRYVEGRWRGISKGEIVRYWQPLPPPPKQL